MTFLRLLPFVVAAMAVFSDDMIYFAGRVVQLMGEIVAQVVEHLPEPAGLVVAHPSFLFWCLFVFRYLRLIVHLFSFWCLYRPAPIPIHPTLSSRDVSVIVPTVDPGNADFGECILSCLYNCPGEIIIVTVGRNRAAVVNQIVGPYRIAFPSTHIQVHFTDLANKRLQVARGVGFAKGQVTVLLDDHVFWRSANFLATVLAPFEDARVGVVGTNKRVRRTRPGLNWHSFWNMLGALYLERHNFEIRATNAIDGGVFVVSGRTAAYRTSILHEPGLMAAYTNERFFFGLFGPLNADDDNFLTREVVTRGYDIKIQYGEDALIETTVGAYPKFLSQCLRWVRTTWRSNSASLIVDRTVWRRQPWCVYAVYLTSFVNFALFYDPALIYSLYTWAGPSAVHALVAWIFVSKMVKLTPYFLREPQDLLMLPGYFAFAYFHSLIKLYALLTFWVISWCGRNLDAVHLNGGNDNDGDNGDDRHSHGSGRLSSGSLTTVPASASASDSSPSTPRARSATQQPTAVSGQVRTPWGLVSGRQSDRSARLATIPANVLDTQLVAPTRRRRITQTTEVGPAAPPTRRVRFRSSNGLTSSDAPAMQSRQRQQQRTRNPPSTSRKSIETAGTSPSVSSFCPSTTASSPSYAPSPVSSSCLSPDLMSRTLTAVVAPQHTPPPERLTRSRTKPRTGEPTPAPQPTSPSLRGSPDLSSTFPTSPSTGAANAANAANADDRPCQTPRTTTPRTSRSTRGTLTSSRSWVRGKPCMCLHSDGDRLSSTRSRECLI